MAATLDGMFHSINNKFEAPVRAHLKSVYACLAMSIISAAVGAYTHLYTQILRGGGLFFGLVGLGLAIGLHATQDTGKNRLQRLGLLLGFAFFSGLGTGPILDMAISIDPAIIPNAFFMSAMIFACFSATSLFAPDGSYLYLGGTLLSGLSMMFWIGFLNFFFRSQIIFTAYLWAGLFLFCGFVIWDTQVIILKRRRGDQDFIGHSLDLFIDFMQIFRKILIILMKKEERNSNKKRRN